MMICDIGFFFGPPFISRQHYGTYVLRFKKHSLLYFE